MCGDAKVGYWSAGSGKGEGAKEEGPGLLHPGPYLLKAGGETGASSIGRRGVINVQPSVISRAVTLSQKG